jgi:hypothetical protein
MFLSQEQGPSIITFLDEYDTLTDKRDRRESFDATGQVGAPTISEEKTLFSFRTKLE